MTGVPEARPPLRSDGPLSFFGAFHPERRASDDPPDPPPLSHDGDGAVVRGL